MQIVNISEFRANLLKYLKQVQHGEEIAVTSSGHILATLIAPESKKEIAKRKLAVLSKDSKIMGLKSNF